MDHLMVYDKVSSIGKMYSNTTDDKVPIRHGSSSSSMVAISRDQEHTKTGPTQPPRHRPRKDQDVFMTFNFALPNSLPFQPSKRFGAPH